MVTDGSVDVLTISTSIDEEDAEEEEGEEEEEEEGTSGDR